MDTILLLMIVCINSYSFDFEIRIHKDPFLRWISKIAVPFNSIWHSRTKFYSNVFRSLRFRSYVNLFQVLQLQNSAASSLKNMIKQVDLTDLIWTVFVSYSGNLIFLTEKWHEPNFLFRMATPFSTSYRFVNYKWAETKYNKQKV